MMYTFDMRRTQILLEEHQHRALAALSRRTGKGLSALVREAVDRLLGSPAPKKARRLSDICGIGRSSKGPSAAEHDKVLYEELQ